MTSFAPIPHVIHNSTPDCRSHCSSSSSRKLTEVSADDLKHSRSIPPEDAAHDVAEFAELARHVPTTWAHAFRVFIVKTGVIIQLGFILGAAAVRTCYGPWRALDTCGECCRGVESGRVKVLTARQVHGVHVVSVAK